MIDEVGVTLGKNVKSEIDIRTCFSFDSIAFLFFSCRCRWRGMYR